MSFPLGVIAYPAASAGTEEVTSSPSVRNFLASFKKNRSSSSSESPSPSPSTPTHPRTPDTPSSWLRPTHRWRRGKRDRQVTAPLPQTPRRDSSSSSDSVSSVLTITPARPGPRYVSALLSRRRFSARADSPTIPFNARLSSNNPRPKHIPLVVPQYAEIVSPQSEDDRRSSFASSLLGSIATTTSATSQHSYSANYDHRKDSGISTNTLEPFFAKRKHVEIQIPKWAYPLDPPASIPPRVHLRHSIFGNPFEEIFTDSGDILPPPPSLPLPPVPTMDAPTAPQGSLYSSKVDTGSNANLASANSSQSSLIGRRPEYESASEAESAQEPDAHVRTLSQSAGPSPPARSSTIKTPPSTGVNLSGLVCNVHRTTGQQPRSLVGATTTVLGDKLYVFGGRRLSRTNPYLTSDLYELDLIKRHWSKIEAKGDVPPPRYFHSVCALGDTKLVCYGGMSPAPAPDTTVEGQAEVIVMSDIHFYDVRSQTWTRINSQDSPQGRYAHCATILPSSAVFTSSNAPLSAIHHNPAGDKPNSGTLGVELDGTGGAEMIVVGGQDSANHYIEQVSVFNLRSLKWTGTTSMGRSCGAYRSVTCPLTTMSASEIGAGPHGQSDADEDDDTGVLGSGAPMLIYSNYNFLDVKLELQVRLTDGTLTEKQMQTGVSPPGLRFPNGGVIDNHFVVSGTFLTSSKQEYALWALDLRTLAWSRIDAGGSIFSQGSWNRGVLWNRRNTFVILGDRKRSLVDDYNNRRINFSHICFVELEAFGLYENPRTVEPFSAFTSASAMLDSPHLDLSAAGRTLKSAGVDLGSLSLGVRELSDMDFLTIDGNRIPVNSRLIAKRWGPHFLSLLGESLASTAEDTDTLRPTAAGHPARNSSITITPVAGSSTATTPKTVTETGDGKPAPPATRPRLFYLPHTAPTLHALLHFLYTSTLPPPSSPLATPQILCSLLQLARPYHIDGLLEAVVQRLHDSLDGRNAAAIFNAAAMGAGGGSGVQFDRPGSKARTTGLLGGENAAEDGAGSANGSLEGEIAGVNGRSVRNTLRPGDIPGIDEPSARDSPNTKTDDESMSESEMSMSSQSLPLRKDRTAWNGSVSSVVGLQKRGLRGLMEGRRMRERGRADTQDSTRVGLGIV